MISYLCVARGSLLHGIYVYRCPLWPRGRNGNMLVADALEGPWNLRLHVVPGRTLRRRT